MSAPPPADTPVAPARTSSVIAEALAVERDDAVLADALDAFNLDYQLGRCALASMTTSPAREAARAAAAESSLSAAASTPSASRPSGRGSRRPRRAASARRSARGKRRRGPESPIRRTLLTTAGVVAGAVAAAVRAPPRAGVGAPRAADDSRSSGRDGPPDAGASSPGTGRARKVMIGLTPKSGFLLWLRTSFLGSSAVSPETTKKALKERRLSTHHHFKGSKAGKRKRDDPVETPARMRFGNAF